MPEQFTDSAVVDRLAQQYNLCHIALIYASICLYRINIYTVHNPLFPPEVKKKFRGTHLQDGEEFYDTRQSTDAPIFAWSYGSNNKRVMEEGAKFDTALKKQGAQDFHPQALFDEEQTQIIREKAVEAANTKSS